MSDTTKSKTVGEDTHLNQRMMNLVSAVESTKQYEAEDQKNTPKTPLPIFAMQMTPSVHSRIPKFAGLGLKKERIEEQSSRSSSATPSPTSQSTPHPVVPVTSIMGKQHQVSQTAMKPGMIPGLSSMSMLPGHTSMLPGAIFQGQLPLPKLMGYHPDRVPQAMQMMLPGSAGMNYGTSGLPIFPGLYGRAMMSEDPGFFESNLFSMKCAFVLHKSNEGHHVCSMCLDCFPDKATLDRHHRAFHVKLEEYTCAVCIKAFSKKSRLKRHFLSHTGRRPHQCTYCKKRFAQKSDLVMHVRIHTGERPFECTVCKKRFTQKVHLHVHMRVHSGERPYQCNTCDKCFATKANLKSHARVHTGEKPYSCTVCNRVFAHKSHFTVHMKSHRDAPTPFVQQIAPIYGALTVPSILPPHSSSSNAKISSNKIAEQDDAPSTPIDATSTPSLTLSSIEKPITSAGNERQL